jgi:hypothetical protein
LKVKLPDEEVGTAYGARWQAQSPEYFKELARLARFKVTKESNENGIFHLEMRKQV